MSRWKNRTDLERFEEKVVPVTESGCWVWIGAGQDRYGSFYLPNYPVKMSKDMVSAHKAALFLYKGVVPEEDKVVLHSCDNGFCCNPNHLKVDTQYENMQDMTRKRRYKISKQKLSEDEVLLAINMRAEGYSVRELSKIFGISEGQMSRVSRGLTHK